MKITKKNDNGEPILFDQLSDNEQRLMTFIGSLRGDYDVSHIGMEKAMSIRLNASSYLKIKAMSNISNQSLNVVVNDLLEVALGYVGENLNDQDFSKLKNEESLVWAEWSDEIKKKEGR